VFVYRQEEDIFLFHIISRPALEPPMQQIPGEEGFSPQSEDVIAAASSAEVNHRVELHLSGGWLSRSPNVRYGLAFGETNFLTVIVLYLLLLKFSPICQII